MASMGGFSMVIQCNNLTIFQQIGSIYMGDVYGYMDVCSCPAAWVGLRSKLQGLCSRGSPSGFAELGQQRSRVQEQWATVLMVDDGLGTILYYIDYTSLWVLRSIVLVLFH